MRRNKQIWMILVLMAVFGGVAIPVGGQGPVGGAEADLAEVLDNMSSEELAQLVKMAAQRRLTVERQQVVGEISQNILYEEDAVKKANALLMGDVKNTQQDNIDRICKAMALVDGRFAGAYKLYQTGRFAEAAKKLKGGLNPEDATYFSAVMHYIHADSLRKAGKTWPAVEAYTEILVNLPDRISFAAASAAEAAKLYESMKRGMYAMEMYTYCLRNYSLTMSNKQTDEMLAKVKAYRKIYGNPIKSVLNLMGQVKQQLDRKDTGKKTLAKQDEVIALLEDLIQTAEEKNRQKKNQKEKDQKRKRQKNQQKKSQQPSQKKKSGQQLSNPRDPTSPAKASVLVPGPVSQPNKLAKMHAGSDTGKWATMPPKQREKLRTLMKQRVGSRRGGLVRDYHRKMAESE